MVQGVDVNEHMVNLGRQQWPDMTALLWVCDAVNLHLFADQSLDAIHTAQVAEHWRAELVPHILQNARIVAPGGLLFLWASTPRNFSPDKAGRCSTRTPPTPAYDRWLGGTSNCIAGWELCTSEFKTVLRSHPELFGSLRLGLVCS